MQSDELAISDKTSKPTEGAERVTPPATDFTNYYSGPLHNAKLLARSSTEPWEAPMISGPCGGPAPKGVYVVEGCHPLKQKLQGGLRENIRGVLATMNPCVWSTVDYLRLGYDEEVEKNNPVVAFITVDKDRLSHVEAQRIVDTISAEFKK
jgi:hypothetical protein